MSFQKCVEKPLNMSNNYKRQLFKMYEFEGYKFPHDKMYKCLNCFNCQLINVTNLIEIYDKNVTKFEITEELFNEYPNNDLFEFINICETCNVPLYTIKKPSIIIESTNAHLILNNVKVTFQKLALPEQQYFKDESSRKRRYNILLLPDKKICYTI